MSEVTLQIGELSRRTGVSTRLLRYYETQGLLRPARDANGYRSYPADSASVVARIRELLDAGLRTREIRDLLPCATPDGIQHCDHSRDVLHTGLTRINAQLTALTRQHALLTTHHDTVLAHPHDPNGPTA